MGGHTAQRAAVHCGAWLAVRRTQPSRRAKSAQMKKQTHPKEPTIHADFLELLGREVEVQVDPLVAILCARPARAQTCGSERRARTAIQACVSVSLIKSVCVLGHSYDRSSPFESSCGHARRCKPSALFGCVVLSTDCRDSVRSVRPTAAISYSPPPIKLWPLR